MKNFKSRFSIILYVFSATKLVIKSHIYFLPALILFRVTCQDYDSADGYDSSHGKSAEEIEGRSSQSHQGIEESDSSEDEVYFIFVS